ncbi:ATP-dependent DNA helicase [Microbacterium enclense]|uniref:ATP-dependent DNA helicase n=1 Tax=Microbacterium enclense TaxID=993073 RepID=UPI003F7E0229
MTADAPIQSEQPTADELLEAFVREATGNPTARPREGQAAAYTSAILALDHRGHFLASLPTGSGKSALALAAAAHRAISFDERTIISTESLSLLGQIIRKDGPAMQRAARSLGCEITIAAHKGISNYVDPRKLFDVANLMAGTDRVWDTAELTERVASASFLPVGLDADGVSLGTLSDLVVWGLGQYADPDATGDRHDYDGDHTHQEWALVSAPSSNLAATEKDTPHLPKAMRARMLASEANIVVTNHTLLGIQAAQGLPVVNGSKKIGFFENIVVDEAHALPSEVRARGAAEVSGRSILSLGRAVTKLVDGSRAASWNSDGIILADHIEQVLAGALGRGDKSKRLVDGDDPLASVVDHVKSWLDRVPSLLKPVAKSPVTSTMLAALRTMERADELEAAVTQVSKHRSGQARWIQADERTTGTRWTSVRASLVDVSGRIANNLWTAVSPDGEEVGLGVICMSATLPPNFHMELGAAAPVVAFPSPFGFAYGNSALYIPAITDDSAGRDVPALTSDRYGPRKFDTAKHTEWAADQLVDLVSANRGSALVLAATAANGRQYVDRIRRALPHIHVYSQWDGATPASLLAQWREDHDSVLVGTRSFMTGVDAPGATCTLLVLDRIPRSPSNPLDDARLEAIMDRTGMDKWAADRLVYAADAALLEQQAVGRLIRAVDDSGMCAVLDPRLVRTKAGVSAGIAYPEATRLVYAEPLRPFSRIIIDRDKALDWVREHRASVERRLAA